LARMQFCRAVNLRVHVPEVINRQLFK
jgi:hypothetical protein